VSPKLLKTDIATTRTFTFMYSVIISTLTPIQKRMYIQGKKKKINVCLTKHPYEPPGNGKI